MSESLARDAAVAAGAVSLGVHAGLAPGELRGNPVVGASLLLAAMLIAAALVAAARARSLPLHLAGLIALFAALTAVALTAGHQH